VQHPLPVLIRFPKLLLWFGVWNYGNSKNVRKRKPSTSSSDKKRIAKEKSWKAAFESKSKQMVMKRDEKIKAMSVAFRKMSESILELKDAIRLIKAQEEETSAALAHIRDAFLELHRRSNKCQGEIDECARNVAKLYVYVERNSSEKHERHSGTRASPSGVLAETGGVGLALPGSFESHKK
jgi:methyl-accepting chemotaxis protein